ncbi:LapA family protein [Chelativorans sp. Marseille-P2723]|uniref:LapA family protein n=1 Tax=Chelativorans sp. Marseille-P2723 TaxID=2709133 RepID=UPI00156ECFFE|nr:LapA family protein [Chelativorans sp. Marseille-P2723]
MLQRIVAVIIILPLAIILIALAVANRAAVPFTIDPFNPGNPALTVELPLFVFLFIALILGVIIGGVVTWFRQGRYRRIARERVREAKTLPATEERSRAALAPPSGV